MNGLRASVHFVNIQRSFLHEVANDVHGQREDDGGVLLGCDGVEGLEVSELKSGWRLCDHQRRLLQSPGCIHLTLRCYNLHYHKPFY